MCLTTSDSSKNPTSTNVASDSTKSYRKRIADRQLFEELKISRRLGWFNVRYFENDAGQATRYVFVNREEYGIRWDNVAFFTAMHVLTFWAIYHMICYRRFNLWLICYFMGLLGGLGSTAGAHRLWSHKGYDASLLVKIFLMICFTSAGQSDIHTWARDHRLHHKFTETDADPHNPLRGLFFAHVGWLLTKKHPDVMIKGATIDYSDLLSDPVVRFNKKYYIPLYLLFRVYFSIQIPCWVLGEDFRTSFMGCFAQYMGQLHTIWFVNSAAHCFGHRPYNNKIRPTDNFLVSIMGMGEGFHNYHHVFPWDYRVGEHGIRFWNPGTWFIELMAKLNLCYDLKRPTQELIDKVVQNTRETDAKTHEFYVDDHPFIHPHPFTSNN